MFDFGSLMGAIGLGKKVISPNADIVPNPGTGGGGGMFNFGNLFSGGGATPGSGGGGLSSILNMVAGAANKPTQAQPSSSIGPAPAINVSNPAPAGIPIAGQPENKKSRLDSLSLGSLLRGGNSNGIQ